MRKTRNIYFGLFLLIPLILNAQNICINEVMSSNETILADEDGDYPDWIELYNGSNSSVNLEGYGISDDRLDLSKSILPKITLLPRKNLLIFASGKDRVGVINHWETEIREGDQCKYTPGTSTIPESWIDLNYDDSNWLSGPSGFGYGDNDDSTIIANLVSVYVRKIFEIQDTAAVLDAVLHVDYDDAFVAYLNGQEIARSNIGIIGIPVSYDQVAISDHEAVMYSGNKPEKFDIGHAKSYLQNGENVLCIQVHNKSATSSDMSLIPFLSLGFSDTPGNAIGTLPILDLKPSYYHTNFKINNDVESLYLSSNEGQIIDSLITNHIPTDISFGRIPDSAPDWFFFDEPTPGEINDSIGTQTITLQSEKPEFSHHRDFYFEPFSLTLTTNTVSSQIRYTTDCSKPTRDYGILYNGPIEISKMTTIRAVAYEDTTLVSDLRTHSFIFPADVLTQDDSGVPEEQHSQDHVFWTEEFDMSDVNISDQEMIDALLDLPTIFISAPYDSIFGISGIHRGQNLEEFGGDPQDPNWIELVECSAEMIYPENYKYGRFNNWQENCGIKIQGGASRWQNGAMDHKQSFTLEFKDQYGAGKLENEILVTAPFNRESVPSEFDKIILRTGFNRDFGSDWDRANYAYTRDQFARDLQILMSGWGNHGTYVHLYINGKYWGITNPCERMDDNALATYFGGDNEDYFYGKGKGGVQSGSADRYNYLNSTDWTNRQYSEIEQYLVVDPYIDNVILHSYGNIGDGAQYYFGGSTNPPGPIYYTCWDMEDSFDGGARRSGPPVALENLEYVYSDDNFLAYYKMKNNIDFKMRFADRIYKHCFNDGILTNERVTAVWDSSCNVIAKSMFAEIARWGDERGAVYDHDHWIEECQDVRDDLIGRGEIYVEEVKNVGMYPNIDPPIFEAGSEVITKSIIHCDSNFNLTIAMLAPPGKIYYTKDGSDPRTWDLTGNVSTSAIDGAVSVTVPITEVTTIKARIKNENTWSPLHELKIIPQNTWQVVINEINYNPSLSFNTEDWVELYNNGENDVDISGWIFKDSDDAHSFVIPQGTILDCNAYLVLCVDTSLFKPLFQDVDNYIGNTGFGLSGSGELIRLYDNQMNVMDSLVYDDNAPWPAQPDGNGPTLSLKNPDLDNRIGENWAASLGYGTPGKINDTFVDVDEKAESIPNEFTLYQNYPNPFNPSTLIRFSIPQNSFVTLKIYDVIGNEIAVLIKEEKSAGNYEVEFSSLKNNLKISSGVYLYQLRANDFMETKKMILIK